MHAVRFFLRWTRWIATPALGLVAAIAFSGLVAAQDIRHLAGHTKAIYTVAYSPDGKLLITGSFDKTVKIWDRASGRVLRTIADHKEPVLSVAVSKDGLRFASGGLDKIVKVYDVPVTSPVFDAPNQPAEFTSLSLSRDGKWLLVGDKGKGLRLWNAETNQLVRDYPGVAAEIIATAFSADANTVWAVQNDGVVRGWTREKGEPVGSFVSPNLTTFTALTDNKQFFTGGSDGVGRVFSWPPQSPAGVAFVGPSAAVGAVATSFDNQWAAVGTADNRVRIHNLSDGQARHNIDAKSGIKAVAVSRDNSQVASGGADGSIRFWRVDNGQAANELEAHPGGVRDVAYSPSNQQLASVGEDGIVRVWRLPLQDRKETKLSEQAFRAGSWSPNGEWIALGGDDRTAKLVRVNDHGDLKTLGGHEGQVSAVAAHPNMSQVVTGSHDGKVRLFNLDGSVVRTFDQHGSAITAVAISPNGQQIASGGSNNIVKLWNAGDGMLVKEIPGHGGQITQMEFSPNQPWLLTAGDNTVRIWNTSDGANVRNIDTGTGAATFCVSRDGSQIAIGGADNQIRVYDLGNGNAIQTLTGHTAGITALAFTPDKKQLISGAGDHTVRVWDVAAKSLLQVSTLPATPRAVGVAHEGKSITVGAEDGFVRNLPLAAVKALAGHQGAATSVVFADNGNKLISSGVDRTIRLWNINEAKQERTFDGSPNEVLDAAISPDNQTVAAVGNDKHLRLWKFDGTQIGAFPLPALGVSISFSNDGKRIAVGCDDKVARLYESPSGVLLEAFVDQTQAVTAVAFSPDGRIVTGSADANVRTASPASVRAAKLHEGAIRKSVVHPNGSQVFTSGEDRLIAMWNVGDLKQQKKFEGVGAVTRALAVSGNQQFLATGSDDRGLRIWEIGNGQVKYQLDTPAPIVQIDVQQEAKTVLAVGADNTVRTFGLVKVDDKDKLEQVQESLGHSAAPTGAALLPDASAAFT
ncbi:MAG TPA: hypothetical protein VGE52_10890, partial [Pirellulales bacterium]